MPAQQRRRLDQERATPPPRQQLAARQQDTIGRPQPRTPNLAPQHLQLMPQHQDLKLLPPLRTTTQNQQLEQTANDPVSERQTLNSRRRVRISRRYPLERPRVTPPPRPRAAPPKRRASLWDPQVSATVGGFLRRAREGADSARGVRRVRSDLCTPQGVLERAPADASVGLPTNRDNRTQVEVCARRQDAGAAVGCRCSVST
jgi:hypothetical protein